MEKFIIANQTAFRYGRNGNGDTCIVLIHGYLESSDVWDDAVKTLSKRYTVVTLDLPGHGISEVKGEIHTLEFLAETLYEALRNDGIEQCFVVGHSLGGYVALALAELHPELLSGLILLNSTPDADSEERAQNRRREIELIRSGRKEVLLNVNPQRVFAPQNRKTFANWIEELREIAMLTEDEGIVALLNGMLQRKDRNEVIDSLTCRVLLIFGSDDELIPRQRSEQIAARHPKAHSVWIENSGHMSFIEQPEATFQAIEQFIDNDSTINA